MSFISSMVDVREDAEDLAQNTFVNAYRALEQYDSDISSFATWLNRIAYHEVLRHARQKRLPVSTLDGDSWLIIRAVDDRVADEWLANVDEERMRLLDEAVGRLPGYDRTLLKLYYTDNLPLKDIAFILDSEAGRLASRLRRIRNKLYIQLKDKMRI